MRISLIFFKTSIEMKPLIYSNSHVYIHEVSIKVPYIFFHFFQINVFMYFKALCLVVLLVSFADIHYFHCLRIVEILKGTEASSKNIFGRYSSQRMKVGGVTQAKIFFSSKIVFCVKIVWVNLFVVSGLAGNCVPL